MTVGLRATTLMATFPACGTHARDAGLEGEGDVYGVWCMHVHAQCSKQLALPASMGGAQCLPTCAPMISTLTRARWELPHHRSGISVHTYIFRRAKRPHEPPGSTLLRGPAWSARGETRRLSRTARHAPVHAVRDRPGEAHTWRGPARSTRGGEALGDCHALQATLSDQCAIHIRGAPSPLLSHRAPFAQRCLSRQ